MAKIVFIHGTYCGSKFRGFQGDCSKDGGFVALRPFIANNQAQVYYWSRVEKNYTFLQSLSPYVWHNIFQIERDYIETREAVYNLNVFLEREQPEIILAHSLGCHYLLNTINEYGAPTSVKQIYTLLPEFSYDKSPILHVQTIERLKENSLTWDNYHCLWDTTLISSMYSTKVIPAGVRSWRQAFIKNQFYIQNIFSNPHTNILCDRKFIKKFIDKSDTLEVRAGQMVV